MNRKLTIGIDLDSHSRKMIQKTIKQWQGLPLRLHAPESYHIPLVSLGWIHEDAVNDVMRALYAVSAQSDVLDLDFTAIAPTYKKIADREAGDVRKAQALWCHGTPSEKLRDLYEDILNELEIPHAEIGKFAPHIVLGQMRKQQWEILESIPEMRVEFPLNFDVMQLTLFEQVVEDGKKIFMPLEVFDLGSE